MGLDIETYPSFLAQIKNVIKIASHVCVIVSWLLVLFEEKSKGSGGELREKVR